MTKFELETALEQEQEINKNLRNRLETTESTINFMRESIKHGKWIDIGQKYVGYPNTYRCSSCGMSFYIDGLPIEKNYYFCPNCCAEMTEMSENNG